MPRYEENVDHDNLRRPDWLLFLRATRAALVRFKLWSVAALVVVLLSLPGYLQTSAAYRRAIGNRYPDADTAREMDVTFTPPVVNLSEVFRQDHGAALRQLDQSLSTSVAALGLFALLFGIFAAGGWLQVTFEQPHRQTLRRFGFGGARYFGRFLRVGIMTVLLLGLWRWLFHGAPWERLVEGGLLGVPEYDRGKLETLTSERQVVHLSWIQDGLFALAFAKTLAWATYTRTRMALRDSRSAVGAGIATAFTMARHPIQTLRPLLLLLLLQAGVVLGLCGWLQGLVEGRFAADPNGWHVTAMFAVGLLALLWGEVARGARYHAAGRVSQALVLPTDSRPDPWAQTVGGPGGPQYPVGDDGYHVTV